MTLLLYYICGNYLTISYIKIICDGCLSKKQCFKAEAKLFTDTFGSLSFFFFFHSRRQGNFIAQNIARHVGGFFFFFFFFFYGKYDNFIEVKINT